MRRNAAKCASGLRIHLPIFLDILGHFIGVTGSSQSLAGNRAHGQFANGGQQLGVHTKILIATNAPFPFTNCTRHQNRSSLHPTLVHVPYFTRSVGSRFSRITCALPHRSFSTGLSMSFTLCLFQSGGGDSRGLTAYPLRRKLLRHWRTWRSSRPPPSSQR